MSDARILMSALALIEEGGLCKGELHEGNAYCLNGATNMATNGTAEYVLDCEVTPRLRALLFTQATTVFPTEMTEAAATLREWAKDDLGDEHYYDGLTDHFYSDVLATFNNMDTTTEETIIAVFRSAVSQVSADDLEGLALAFEAVQPPQTTQEVSDAAATA